MIIDTTQTKIERRLQKSALLLAWAQGFTKLAASMKKIESSTYVAVTKVRSYILLADEELECLERIRREE